jgi:hypothetical protein
MKPTHTYILEPYRSLASRHRCPSCGEIRQFTRYINTQTNQSLADHVGRCNREQNCSYHYTPKQYFLDHPETTPLSFLQREGAGGEFFNPTLSHCHISKLSHSLIPVSIFQQSLSNYSHNHFINWLSTHFDQSTISKLINTYLIGTSKNWPGSTVFWQIDTHGNIRDGKIMLYDPTTGHRVKHPYNHITWAHSALKLKDYNLQQCFFGEHLLKLHPKLPVSIVESEKTAILASVYFPQFIWLATGGKHGCKWTTPQVFNILKARHITLWPDIKAYEDWKIKAWDIQKSGLQITISNFLEQVATDSEREAGLDIADYLIRFKPNQFIDIPLDAKVPVIVSLPILTPLHSILPLYQQTPIASHPSPFLGEGQGMRSLWPLDTLESFFSSIEQPEPPIRLNQCTTILDLPKFISCHLSILHRNNGNPVFLPYLHRLQLVQQIIR